MQKDNHREEDYGPTKDIHSFFRYRPVQRDASLVVNLLLFLFWIFLAAAIISIISGLIMCILYKLNFLKAIDNSVLILIGRYQRTKNGKNISWKTFEYVVLIVGRLLLIYVAISRALSTMESQNNPLFLASVLVVNPGIFTKNSKTYKLIGNLEDLKDKESLCYETINGEEKLRKDLLLMPTIRVRYWTMMTRGRFLYDVTIRITLSKSNKADKQHQDEKLEGDVIFSYEKKFSMVRGIRQCTFRLEPNDFNFIVDRVIQNHKAFSEYTNDLAAAASNEQNLVDIAIEQSLHTNYNSHWKRRRDEGQVRRLMKERDRKIKKSQQEITTKPEHEYSLLVVINGSDKNGHRFHLAKHYFAENVWLNTRFAKTEGFIDDPKTHRLEKKIHRFQNFSKVVRYDDDYKNFWYALCQRKSIVIKSDTDSNIITSIESTPNQQDFNDPFDTFENSKLKLYLPYMRLSDEKHEIEADEWDIRLVNHFYEKWYCKDHLIRKLKNKMNKNGLDLSV